MQNLKFKIAFLLGVFLMISFVFGVTVYATNENIQIIKESEERYLIYVKGNLDSSFEFAFSNTNTEPASTEFVGAGTDALTDGAYIAYLDEYSTANKFLWVKNTEDYILDGIEVDLSKAIEKTELENIQNITKIIKADTTKTNVEEKELDGNKVIVTTGKVLLQEEGDYTYQIFKLPASEEYNELMDLAERISKFNEETDLYSKLEIYNRFNVLFKKLASELDSEKWEEVQNLTILQPEDARNGDKFVLWIKNGDVLDAQFLVSKYEEEKVVEKITTKLPVTYDNNTLLIVLAILVIALVIISIRIKSLKKKNK